MFLIPRKPLKKLIVLAIALLPLGYATAASAEPGGLGFQDPISAPQLNYPTTITTDSNGNLWVNNQMNGDSYLNGTIQEINISNGTPFFGTTIVTNPPSNGAVVIGNTLYYVLTDFPGIKSVDLTSQVQTPGPTFIFPYSNQSLISGPGGFLYLNTGYNGIFQIDPATLQQTGVVIAVNANSMSIGATANTIVAPSENYQVSIYNLDGSVLHSYSTTIYAASVTVDPQGNIWVGDYSGNLQEIINGQLQPAIYNPIEVCDTYGMTSDLNGNIWITDLCGGPGDSLRNATIQEYVNNLPVTGPNTVSNLTVASVGHTTLKLTWGSDNPSDTQYVCTASNGASKTVTGNSCSLKGFDLYHSGNYTVSVTAVNSQGQSDPVMLNVQL